MTEGRPCSIGEHQYSKIELDDHDEFWIDVGEVGKQICIHVHQQKLVRRSVVDRRFIGELPVKIAHVSVALLRVEQDGGTN